MARPRLRSVTWNLHGVPNPGGRSTPEQQARAWNYLAAVDADLMLLQEVGYADIPAWVHGRWTLLRGTVGRHQKRYAWGSVIAARPDLALHEPDAAYEDPALRRLYTGGVLVGALTLPDGEIARVASVHPAAGKTLGVFLAGEDPSTAVGFSRAELLRPGFQELEPKVIDLAFRALCRYAGGGRFVVAGDWNIARSFGPGQRAFFNRASTEGWVDCHAAKNGQEVPTFFPRGGRRQLDHVFCDEVSARSLADCRVVREPWLAEVSDHAPLVAEFQWPERAQPAM